LHFMQTWDMSKEQNNFTTKHVEVTKFIYLSVDCSMVSHSINAISFQP
jgi:hypothetical protein